MAAPRNTAFRLFFSCVTDFSLSVWGSQSWLQPAFSRPLLIRNIGLSLFLAAALAAQASETPVNDFIAEVRAGVKQHIPDKALAKSVHKLTLSEKLNLRVLEELESEGAGPETLAAIDDLRDKSAKLPEAT